MQKRYNPFIASNRSHLIVLFVLAVGVGLSVYAFHAYQASEAARLRFEFETVASQHIAAARSNIRKSVDATSYVGSVFEAIGNIDRIAFDRFATDILKSNPVIKRLAWLPIVRPDNRAAILDLAAASGVKDFRIVEKDGLGSIIPATLRPVYFPVLYVAPYDVNAHLVGLDFGSDPTARAVLDKAMWSGVGVTAQNKARFSANDGDEPTYYVFIPVWTRSSQAADRRLNGFVLEELGLRSMVQLGAPPAQAKSRQLVLFSRSSEAPGELLYPSHLDGVGVDGIQDAGGIFEDVNFGPGTWRIAALPLGSLAPGLTWKSGFVLGGGLAISASLAAYLWLVFRRRKNTEKLVYLRTEEVEAALAQLKVTEKRLNDYVTTASDWYWDAGPNFRFTRVADRALEHGINPKELIGLDQLIDGDAPAAIEKRLEVLGRHEPFKDLRYDYAGDDRLLILSLSGTPKFDEKGAFSGYRGSARDITPQLRAEAEQRAARFAAEQANNAKSAFLANMSHEIRTPMNGVLGMVQILRQTKLNDEQGQMCEVISHSGSALLQILNDILDFSKLEAGKIELETVDCCLTEVVSDIVSLMRHTAEPKGISLLFEHGPIASPWVVGDPTRLRQILLNLIANGIKFSERGGVWVRLDAEETDGATGKRLKFVLSVTDHGIGMSAEDQRLLFRRFSQADASSTRRFGGTGLGLAITQELVKLMGGKISVESKVGEGSTFTVRLELPLASHQGVVVASESAPTCDGPVTHLNVLVAEDDSVNRLVIRMIMQAQGHKVTLVENGQEAIDAVLAAPYDLVLMDVMMPGTDGVTATRRIRESAAPVSGIPIIALTANAMKGDRDTYLAAGMNAYVSKPIDKKLLFSAIGQVLGVRAWSETEPESLPEIGPSAEGLNQLEDFISSL